MKTKVSHSLEDTENIAKEWISTISDMVIDDEAFVVGLRGHLGAGKTAFVKSVGELLGIKEEITSPTFVLMKIYTIVHPKWHRLVHIDAYRLEKRQELDALRYEDLVSDPHNLIMVEWPENVGLKEFKPNALIRFEIKGGGYEIKY